MADPPYVFVTRVEQMESGVATNVILIPPEVADTLVQNNQRRIILTINGQEIRRYLFRSADGIDAVVVGKRVLRDLGIDTVEPFVVEVLPDPDPDRVDVPAELEAALDQDQEAADRFYGMTPGKQRSLSLYVNEAKREATRVKRALELTHKLRTYTLYGDKQP